MFVLATIAGVVETGEDVDVAVMIGGSEDMVEVDHPVEEVPGEVANQRAQERLDGHRMAAAGPAYMGEILVALEFEAAQRE